MTVFDGKFIASCVGLNGSYILESTDPSAGQGNREDGTKEIRTGHEDCLAANEH